MTAPQRQTWSPDARGRLDAEVRRRTGLSNKKARLAVLTGKVFVDGEPALDPAAQVGPAATLSFDMAAPNPARVRPFDVRRVYRDDHLLVIDKPSGLPSTPSPDREGPTALHAAQRLCKGPRRPKVVHRLDMDTSGLLVFARSVPAARALREALDAHAVHRVYRCVVAGRPQRDMGLVSSMLVRDAGEGRRGSRRGTFKVRDIDDRDPGPMPGAGKLAITRYRVVASDRERSALEVRLATGRTHQIRIHLAELGCPVLGERVYARVADAAPRLALHAAVLELDHPVTGERLRFESRWPDDLAEVTPVGPRW